MLPLYEKILECVVKEQLVQYIEEYNILLGLENSILVRRLLI
jgi:hypothetical protein